MHTGLSNLLRAIPSGMSQSPVTPISKFVKSLFSFAPAKVSIAERYEKNRADESTILAQIAAKGMAEKKGHDIVIMDLRNVKSAVTDYFVICHGDSNTQVEAIAGSVEEEISQGGG